MLPLSPACAALPVQAVAKAATAAPAADGLQSSLTQAGIAVALLIGVIGLCGYGFKKLMQRTLVSRAERRSLTLVDVLPLGGKQKICVLRCYDRTFLVGVGEGDVSTLAELDSEIGRKEAPLAVEPDQKEAFLEVLSAEQRKAVLARAQEEVARRENDRRAALLAAVHSAEQDEILEPQPRRKTKKKSTAEPLPPGVNLLKPKAPAKRKRATLKKRPAESSTPEELDALTVRRVVPRTVAQAATRSDDGTRPLGGGLIA